MHLTHTTQTPLVDESTDRPCSERTCENLLATMRTTTEIVGLASSLSFGVIKGSRDGCIPSSREVV
jgi:hypothetical protein